MGNPSMRPCTPLSELRPHRPHPGCKQAREPSEPLCPSPRPGLQRKLLSGQAQIIEAKVPIIKCKLQFGEQVGSCRGTDWSEKLVAVTRRPEVILP